MDDRIPGAVFPGTLDEVIREVNRVERLDLREVARKIFDDANLNLSLIGPLKGMEDKIRKDLTLG